MSNTQLATRTEEDPVEFGTIPSLAPNSSLAVSLARAEVDQQIATARALPRQLSRVVSNILTLATLDEQSAEECVYALPRGGKPIKGPSIRLAEIIASQWGNCRVGARVVHVDRFEKFVEAEGVFHDLETNTAVTARVRRRLSDSKGRLFNDDMIVVTGNAACAIAKRNAILGAVPKGVWRRAYDAVESVIAGDTKTLAERRDRALKSFAAFGVKPEQIAAVLEIGGMDDLTLDHLVTLTGMHSALKSGESTVEEMFPAKAVDGDAPKGTKAKLDQVAEKGRKGVGPDEKVTTDGEVVKNETSAATTQETRNDATGRASEEAGPADGDGGSSASSSNNAGDEDPGQQDARVEEVDPESPRGQVIAKLRTKAQRGPRALKLGIAALSNDERSLLTAEDTAALEATAAEPTNQN
jgi:hypothetical protein